jgi:diacylglycerol kinase family enzyme
LLISTTVSVLKPQGDGTVTFANAVTQVGMPQANLTAQLLGLGGATADSFDRLSVNTPALLFNNAGAGIEATVNKAATGNDAAFAFKTGFPRPCLGRLAIVKRPRLLGPWRLRVICAR